MIKPHLALLLGISGALMAGPVHPQSYAGAPVMLAAAASTQEAVGEAAALYHKSTGRRVTLVFNASSTLARQIESGLAADVFLSAHPEWIDYLAGRGLIRQGQRKTLFANTLVLAAPASSSLTFSFTPGSSLIAALGEGKLALADPGHVPVGRYARQALEALGVWSALSGRILRAPNARAALSWIARGEVAAGIVYGTDIAVEPLVKTIAVLPPEITPAIRYEGAVLATANMATAIPLLDFLASAEALGVFRRHGFLAAPEPGA